MADALEKWMEAIEEVERVLNPVREMLARALEPGSELRTLASAWPRIAERFTSLSQVVRDACERAALPPFRLMDIDEWSAIEQASKHGGIDAAADAVARLSREALESPENRAELLRDWRKNRIAATRADVLEQALKAHELGLFAVSIPPFLAHLEGVIADAKHAPDARKNPKFDELKRYVSELADGDEYMGRIISEYVSDTVYQSFVRNTDAPPFSRHAILHGFDTRYATAMNSVRAILTFDCVQDLVLEHQKALEDGG